jgi:thymidylate synthase
MSKSKANERREKLDQIRKEQKSADRQRNWLFAGVGGVAALAIVGGSIYAVQQVEANKPENQELSAFGVSASAASCTDNLATKSEGVNDHVPTLGEDGNPTVVKYSTVPPAFGPHYGAPAPFERGFYTARDKPAMEELVHNLEHGYKVVWYDDALPDDQKQDLEDIVTNLRGDADTQKIIASAWDPAYGELPDGKLVAMSHWGTKEGVRKLCGAVSGEAIGAFATDHPPTDSPEPFGA